MAKILETTHSTITKNELQLKIKYIRSAANGAMLNVYLPQETEAIQ